MKHLLFAIYIFSVLYCYLKMNVMIDRCISVFVERHPLIPIGNPPWNKGFKLTLELLAISSIPIVNIFLGVAFSVIGDDAVSEIVDSVEMKHIHDIQEIEAITDKMEDLDKYF